MIKKYEELEQLETMEKENSQSVPKHDGKKKRKKGSKKALEV